MGDEEEIVKITDFVEAETLRIMNKTIDPPSFQLINGYIDRTKIIEVWDDFIGSNGADDTVEPGYPWCTDGSDTVAIKSKGIHGGVWELSIPASSAQDDQMILQLGRGTATNRNGGSLVAGETGQFYLGRPPTNGIYPEPRTFGKSLHFKARFRRTHSTDDDHGFFIGLTSHNDEDLIVDHTDTSIKGIIAAQSHYGLLMLKTQNEGKYKVVGQASGYSSSWNQSWNLGSEDALVAGAKHSGYWPTENVGQTGQLSTAAGTGEGMDPDLGWIVFEMNINHQNTSEDNFTVSYRLYDESSESTYQTGDIFTANASCSAVIVSGPEKGYHAQAYMSPAIHLKKGASSSDVLSYEIDYIHCVQKR